MQQHEIEQALQLLGAVLGDRGLLYHVVVIGGAAMLLTTDDARSTEDVDILAVGEEFPGTSAVLSPLPAALVAAADDVADAFGIRRDWLNDAPRGSLDHRKLPEGLMGRAAARSYGALTVYVADRSDLLRLKLLAAADEGIGRHTEDIERLRPSEPELAEAIGWVRSVMPPQSFELDDIVAHLGENL